MLQLCSTFRPQLLFSPQIRFTDGFLFRQINFGSSNSVVSLRPVIRCQRVSGGRGGANRSKPAKPPVKEGSNKTVIEGLVTESLPNGMFRVDLENGDNILGYICVNDDAFMDMFVATGAIDVLENERQQLQKRQKILQSCLTEFITVAHSLY